MLNLFRSLQSEVSTQFSGPSSKIFRYLYQRTGWFFENTVSVFAVSLISNILAAHTRKTSRPLKNNRRKTYVFAKRQ